MLDDRLRVRRWREAPRPPFCGRWLLAVLLAGVAGCESGTGPPDEPDPGDCGAIATFETGLSPDLEIHVASEGDDSNGDGSEANPYGSVTRAVQDAAPGVAIRVHEGTYPGGAFVSELRGAPEEPVWIGGVEGEDRPVFEGGGEGLHFSRISYLVLHDLEIAGASQNGINTDDGGDVADEQATHHLVLRNLSIHDVGGTGNQDCLKLSGVSHYWVLQSEFERCGGGGSGSGIDQVGTHDGVLARNIFRQMSGNAVQVKGGSENVEIRGNRITDGGLRALNMGGSTGDPFFRPPLSMGAPNFEARHISAVANVLEGANAAIAFVGCVDCLAANNTIVNPERWIFRILQETVSHGGFTFLPARDGLVVNNLIYFERGALSTDVNVGPDTEPSTFRFETNLWYAWDAPSESAPDLPGTEVGSIVGADPDFTTGYRIDESSPAAGAGTTVSDVGADIEGACYSDPPSIGAYSGD